MHIASFRSLASRYYWHFIHNHFPYWWAKHIYPHEVGKILHLSNPQDINEKILWLEYFTDTRQWSRLTDKYAVREFVRSHCGDDILVPLLGRWEKIEDIDFSSLPESFVIKPNNGSYDTIIVMDKKNTDLDNIKSRLSCSLHKKFGHNNGEAHYLRIKPCIIAEKILTTKNTLGLIDYKIWCFYGKPYGIMVCGERNPETHHAKLMFYDLQWNRREDLISESFRNDFSCPKPKNFDKMVTIATKLSQGFPQCRVDMYNIEGKVYFGEMTFTSNYGMMPYFTQELLNDMGNHCPLPQRALNDRWQSFVTRYMPMFL